MRGHSAGYPASHGCIRMPSAAAEMFYSTSREPRWSLVTNCAAKKPFSKKLSAVWLASCLKVSIGREMRCLTIVAAAGGGTK